MALVADARDRLVDIAAVHQPEPGAVVGQRDHHRPLLVAREDHGVGRIGVRAGVPLEVRREAQVAVGYAKVADALVFRPVHGHRAVHAQGQKPVGVVEVEGDRLDVEGADAATPILALGALGLGMAAGVQQLVPDHGGVATEHRLAMGGRRRLEPRRCVEPQRALERRRGQRQLRHPLQARTRRLHRQRPAEGGDLDVVEIAVASAGAVEPVGLAADLGADDHVVERQQRQPLVEPVAAAGADQSRLGVDPQLVQQRQQQHGLALAVAEAPRPGGVRVGGDQPAEVHADEGVANLILHETQGRGGPRLRIGRRGGDLLRLGA